MIAKRQTRREAVSAHKRELILDAARQVFSEEGLDGASLRAIAVKSGYTPAALYFHFDSKEAIYAELLSVSLRLLGEAVHRAASQAADAEQLFRDVVLAFFDYYASNPQDLDLGFYLFRGGMKPAGLGPQRDHELNAALEAALQPIADAAIALGVSRDKANLIMVDCFAHAAGLLLLLHTGRIRMFDASAKALMEAYIQEKIEYMGRC